MSIFKKDRIAAEFPAYTIWEREPHTVMLSDDGQHREVSNVVEITTADKLALKARDYYRKYSPGSVVSYALEYNEDPIAEVAKAQARGETLHWINAVGSCITAEKRVVEHLVLVKIGMLVRFEGKLFTIQAAPNDNLQFVPAVV